MNDETKKKLKETIQKEGLSVALNLRHLKELLSNLSPLSPAQQDRIDALLEAVKKKVTLDIIKSQGQNITEDRFKRLTTQLRRNSNIPKEIAQWTVASWIEALKKRMLIKRRLLPQFLRQ